MASCCSRPAIFARRRFARSMAASTPGSCQAHLAHRAGPAAGLRKRVRQSCTRDQHGLATIRQGRQRRRRAVDLPAGAGQLRPARRCRAPDHAASAAVEPRVAGIAAARGRPARRPGLRDRPLWLRHTALPSRLRSVRAAHRSGPAAQAEVTEGARFLCMSNPAVSKPTMSRPVHRPAQTGTSTASPGWRSRSRWA